MSVNANPPYQIFICYAREDRTALEALLGHIAVFEKSGLAKIWYDREITGGKNWDEEIRVNIKAADIVLLLISPDFFRSDYIHTVELDEAIQRDKNKEALVVPVILKKCLWHKDTRISTLQALPEAGQPVFDKTFWSDPDDAFYDIAIGLDRILEDPETEKRRAEKQHRVEFQKRVQRFQKMLESGEIYGEMCLSDDCTVTKGREFMTSSLTCILLIEGKETGGVPVFIYLAIKEDYVSSLLEACKSGAYYPEDYGVIIELGLNNPSHAIKAKLEEDYGFDHNGAVRLV